MDSDHGATADDELQAEWKHRIPDDTRRAKVNVLMDKAVPEQTNTAIVELTAPADSKIAGTGSDQPIQSATPSGGGAASVGDAAAAVVAAERVAGPTKKDGYSSQPCSEGAQTPSRALAKYHLDQVMTIDVEVLKSSSDTVRALTQSVSHTVTALATVHERTTARCVELLASRQASQEKNQSSPTVVVEVLQSSSDILIALALSLSHTVTALAQSSSNDVTALATVHERTTARCVELLASRQASQKKNHLEVAQKDFESLGVEECNATMNPAVLERTAPVDSNTAGTGATQPIQTATTSVEAAAVVGAEQVDSPTKKDGYTSVERGTRAQSTFVSRTVANGR